MPFLVHNFQKEHSLMLKITTDSKHNTVIHLSTYRFLDFFFFVPSGPTSQLQGDPELSWGEMKESTHCIIQHPHRERGPRGLMQTLQLAAD